MAVSKKAWLGVARESVSGTPISTPTMLVPTRAGFKNHKKFVYQDEERGTRDGNNARVDTTRYADGSAKGSWYNDSSPYWLMTAFADTPTTVVANVYSHALALADVPSSLTLFRALDSAATYQLGYAVGKKFAWKWSAAEKTLEFETDFEALYSGPKMGSPPARPADTTVLAMAGFLPTIQLGGSQSMDVESMTITLEQKIERWYGCAGSADFTVIYFGERTCKVELDARFDADTFYSNFTGDTDQHVNVTFVGPQLIASTYHEQLALDLPIVGWDEMDHDTGKVNIQVKAKGTARPGTSIGSLMTVTVQNGIANYTV